VPVATSAFAQARTALQRSPGPPYSSEIGSGLPYNVRPVPHTAARSGRACPTSFARSRIQQRDRVAEVRVRQDTPKRHRRPVGHPHPHPGCPRAGTAFRRAVRVRGSQCRAARRPASGATARRKVTRARAVGASPVGGQRRALGGRNRDRPQARPASWRAARPHQDRLLAPSGNAA